MTNDELEALAVRVESLEGPDREVDADIHEAVTSFAPRHGGVGWSFGTLIVPVFPGWKELPYYTTSIDAAMTLVPEGWWLMALNFIPTDFRSAQDREWHAEVGGPITWATFDEMPEPQFNGEGGNAAMPALALLAAALRTRKMT